MFLWLPFLCFGFGFPALLPFRVQCAAVWSGQEKCQYLHDQLSVKEESERAVKDLDERLEFVLSANPQ
jgi:hypothetical protein